jgi:hypothetical protein
MAWRDNELAARAADALGEPDGVYHLTLGRRIAFITVATLSVAWAIIGSFVWFGVFKAGAKGLKGYIFLVLAPAFIGISMFASLWRSRGLTVLTYPTGILVVNRGEVWTFPWDDIATISLGSGKTPLVETDESGAVRWVAIPGTNSAWYGGTNSLTITTADGREGVIPVAVPGFRDLSVRIQKETFPRLWGETWSRFCGGEPIDFGLVTATFAGLSDGKKELLWDDFKEIAVSGKLVVRKTGGWIKDWRNDDLGNYPNANLLVRLAEAVTRGEMTAAEEPTE